jgi:hypothetical protein
MNIKGLLFGLAAVLVVVSGAHASDAVVPDETQSLGTEHINACDAYGTGFVAMPGTGTCVRVSGEVRYEQRFSNTGRASYGRTTMDFETRSD